MNKLILKSIQLIHFLVVLFIVYVPFTNDESLLFLHFVFIPFLYVHWLTNNNVCALTMLEQKIQQKVHGKSNKNECFTCKIINPVFDVHKNHKNMNKFIYISTFSLWCITTYKLYNMKRGTIKAYYKKYL